MCDPAESSQLKEWLFAPQDLELCRTRANLVARKYLAARKEQELPTAEDSTNNRNSKHETSLPVECFAQEFGIHKESFASENEGPMKCDEGNEYLNPNEEALLVSFYASKLPSLMGPSAQMPRLRREPKVPATAAMLLHRFYLSNSVMVHDPKTIMVSAAFGQQGGRRHDGWTVFGRRDQLDERSCVLVGNHTCRNPFALGRQF